MISLQLPAAYALYPSGQGCRRPCAPLSPARSRRSSPSQPASLSPHPAQSASGRLSCLRLRRTHLHAAPETGFSGAADSSFATDIDTTPVTSPGTSPTGSFDDAAPTAPTTAHKLPPQLAAALPSPGEWRQGSTTALYVPVQSEWLSNVQDIDAWQDDLEQQLSVMYPGVQAIRWQLADLHDFLRANMSWRLPEQPTLMTQSMDCEHSNIDIANANSDDEDGGEGVGDGDEDGEGDEDEDEQCFMDFGEVPLPRLVWNSVLCPEGEVVVTNNGLERQFPWGPVELAGPVTVREFVEGVIGSGFSADPEWVEWVRGGRGRAALAREYPYYSEEQAAKVLEGAVSPTGVVNLWPFAGKWRSFQGLTARGDGRYVMSLGS